MHPIRTSPIRELHHPIPWYHEHSYATYYYLIGQQFRNPRALSDALTPAGAWSFVADWLDAPAAWVPRPGRGYRDILGRLVCDLDLRGNLVSDAALAALALEHGLAVVSADSDFARFPELTWLNPVSP
ncbi:MAG: PIN domain-containing protein [Acidimicrobiales bacterium]